MPAMDQPPMSQPAAPHHSKRRQYAANQAHIYYNDGVGADPNYLGGGAPMQQQQQGGGQLFTPGLAAVEGQFAAQQSQPYYAQPAQDYGAAGYPQQPVYGKAPTPVNALVDQFGQMGMGGQKLPQLFTTNLLTTPPDPFELVKPPPEIVLPPNACLSSSPEANAHYSYQRSTLNAIPTSSSLLNKSKIPLALILTPYRTLDEGEEPVPVVTDTVIARCRRCRTYINPYVTFIDGGNRSVYHLVCYLQVS
jgi:protein transport protein SEC24